MGLEGQDGQGEDEIPAVTDHLVLFQAPCYDIHDTQASYSVFMSN